MLFSDKPLFESIIPVCRPGQGHAALRAGSRKVQKPIFKSDTFGFNAGEWDIVLSFNYQAADYFKGEESNSSANKCMLKVFYALLFIDE